MPTYVTALKCVVYFCFGVYHSYLTLQNTFSVIFMSCLFYNIRSLVVLLIFSTDALQTFLISGPVLKKLHAQQNSVREMFFFLRNISQRL